MNEVDPAPPGAAPGQPNRAVIIAFLVGGFALVTVSMLAQKFRNAPVRQVPLIRITGDSLSVANPATIRFMTTAPLTSSAQGWMAGDLHPHALIDQQVIMPMGPDIVNIAADTFALTLPRLDAGFHHLRLYWADAAHKAVGDSAHVVLRITR
jgi:hypothetical protein